MRFSSLLFLLLPGVALAGADGDLYTVAGGDCDDASAAVNPGITEACNAVDDDCDGAVDEIGATPFQCNSFPTMAAPPNNSSSGAFLLHVEKFVPSVDLTGTPIYSNSGVGTSTPGGPETNVHSILVRNWQGTSVNGSINAELTMTFPSEVSILGWVVQFQGQTDYVRDLDSTFSVTGQDLSIPNRATDMELSGSGSDYAYVAFDQAIFESSAGSGGADEARLLISYDPATSGPLTFDVVVTGTLQNIIHCDAQLPGSGTFTIDLADEDPDMADVDTDGYTACTGDCNDGLFYVNPGRPELCDGADNNCDGNIDEGFDVDADGWTTCAGDCDDASAAVNPGATEDCVNGIDDDCDGAADASDPDCASGDDDDATGDDDDATGDDDDATGDDDDSGTGDDDDTTGDDDDATGDDDDTTGDDDDATGDDDDATGDDDDATGDDDDTTGDDDDSTVAPGDDDDGSTPECGCTASASETPAAGWLLAGLLGFVGRRRRR